MDSIINFLSQIHLKDGIMAVIVVYLLYADRRDRKADREFLMALLEKFDKKKEKDA